MKLAQFRITHFGTLATGLAIGLGIPSVVDFYAAVGLANRGLGTAFCFAFVWFVLGWLYHGLWVTILRRMLRHKWRSMGTVSTQNQ